MAALMISIVQPINPNRCRVGIILLERLIGGTKKKYTRRATFKVA